MSIMQNKFHNAKKTRCVLKTALIFIKQNITSFFNVTVRFTQLVHRHLHRSSMLCWFPRTGTLKPATEDPVPLPQSPTELRVSVPSS